MANIRDARNKRRWKSKYKAEMIIPTIEAGDIYKLTKTIFDLLKCSVTKEIVTLKVTNTTHGMVHVKKLWEDGTTKEQDLTSEQFRKAVLKYGNEKMWDGKYITNS